VVSKSKAWWGWCGAHSLGNFAGHNTIISLDKGFRNWHEPILFS
jgi:hypothetical protein